jgi:hypothetical protein
MQTIVNDYLYSFQLDNIDNDALFNKCLVMEDIIIQTTPPAEKGWYGNLTSAKNQSYNLFTFPVKELHELYQAMVKNISPLLDKDTSYVLKSWMNVYRKGDKVSWHMHWEPQFKVWHGFYCVNVGKNESATNYKIPGIKEIINVPSVDGLLVVGKSDDDRHSSTEWQGDKPRITLAFDIVPMWAVNPNENTTMYDLQLYHYIPFKT